MERARARRSRGVAVTCAALGVLLGVSPRAGAQEIFGRLLEKGSGRPIPQGELVLLDLERRPVLRTFSNERGAFILAPRRPGSYMLQAEALGYQRLVDGVLDLDEGGRMTIAFYLPPAPVELRRVTATVERRDLGRILESAGFYTRRAGGLGHFIDIEDIRRLDARTPLDLLRRVPRVTVWEDPILGASLFMRGGTEGLCQARIYLDGSLTGRVTGTLEGLVAVSDIAAIEVYTGASTVPLQFGGTQEGCGAIVIWTR